MKKSNLLILIVFTILSVLAFGSNGKFSGEAFFYYVQEAESDSVSSFDFDEVHFVYSENISDGIRYDFRIDLKRINESPIAAFLKEAKVDWQTRLGLFTIGLQGMNVFNQQESNWGYRFVAPAPMDMYGFAPSHDLGIGYSNSFTKDLNFSIKATNGTGEKDADNNSYRRISTQVVFGETALGANPGLNFGGIYTFESDGASEDLKDITLLGAFGAFATSKFRVGAEFEQLSFKTDSLNKQIIAAYADIPLPYDVKLFSRYSQFQNDDESSDDSCDLLIVGLYYSAGKGLAIAPNVNFTSFEDKAKDDLIQYKLNFELKF